MKSGLGDRNNDSHLVYCIYGGKGLNEVRSWRPEQFLDPPRMLRLAPSVSMKSGLGDRNNEEVLEEAGETIGVSMKSGLGDRNNGPAVARPGRRPRPRSQ